MSKFRCASRQDRPMTRFHDPKVRQKKQPADYVVDFLIGLLVVAVVIVVLYPLWFIVIASFSTRRWFPRVGSPSSRRDRLRGLCQDP